MLEIPYSPRPILRVSGVCYCIEFKNFSVRCNVVDKTQDLQLDGLGSYPGSFPSLLCNRGQIT